MHFNAKSCFLGVSPPPWILVRCEYTWFAFTLLIFYLFILQTILGETEEEDDEILPRKDYEVKYLKNELDLLGRSIPEKRRERDCWELLLRP